MDLLLACKCKQTSRERRRWPCDITNNLANTFWEAKCEQKKQSALTVGLLDKNSPWLKWVCTEFLPNEMQLSRVRRVMRSTCLCWSLLQPPLCPQLVLRPGQNIRHTSHTPLSCLRARPLSLGAPCLLVLLGLFFDPVSSALLWISGLRKRSALQRAYLGHSEWCHNVTPHLAHKALSAAVNMSQTVEIIPRKSSHCFPVKQQMVTFTDPWVKTHCFDTIQVYQAIWEGGTVSLTYRASDCTTRWNDASQWIQFTARADELF